MRIGLGFYGLGLFRRGLRPRRNSRFRGRFGILRRPCRFCRSRFGSCWRLVGSRHGVDHCRGLSDRDFALFRRRVALLCRLGAAPRQCDHQRCGTREGNISRHIKLHLSFSTGHARNCETLPSPANAITSNASVLPSGISIPGDPRGMPGTAIPRMSRGLSRSSFATCGIGKWPSMA